MNCLFKKNPAGGFQDSHRQRCSFCSNDATHHLSVSYFCGNCCKAHAEKQAARHKEAEVENEIVVMEAV